jgi:4-amino-4-deoxy-L-arabinose transferase-like glycosyltransferase
MVVLIGHSEPPLTEPPTAAPPPRRRTPRRPPSRTLRWKPLRTGAVPAALALAWLAVMLVHLRLPYPSDQLNYLEAAQRFPRPLEGTDLVHQVTRFGLIIPARLAIMVFGYSQAAYYVVPLLGTLALLLGTYAIGAQLFGRWVGAAAGIVVVAATPMFRDSTDLLPDVLAAGLFTLALAMALAIRRGRLPARWWVLAGLGALLGWSYLVREFIVFVWPLVPVLIVRRVRWTGLLVLAAPIAALVATELLLCWKLYGDPLARLYAVTGHGSAPSPPEIAATYRDLPRHVYVRRLPRALLRYREGEWMVLLLGLTLLGGLLRPRRFAVPVAWCALLWVPLTLLGGIIDPSAPKLRLQLIRYWFPIFPAFVIGGLGLIWLAGVFAVARMRGRESGRPLLGRAAVALPAALVVAVAAWTATTSARTWWAAGDTRAGGATQLEQFRTWMAGHGDGVRVVWADRRTAKTLDVYRQGPFGGRAWDAVAGRALPGGPAPAPGDLVVFFDADRGGICPQCADDARLTWGDPPRPRPGWRAVYATRDGVVRVYHVDR